MSSTANTVTDTHWVAIARYAPDSFAGSLSAATFALRSAALAPIADGQFFVRITIASVDPYMIRLLDADGGESELNRTARGVFGVEAIGTIVESRHGDYRIGESVIGDFGWRQFVVSDGGAGVRPLLPVCASASLAAALRAQPSLALGALGMPGATAYFGLFKLLAPRAGQTLVVSACAGAVGSLVAQMAKSLGCRVVGITSTPAKAAACAALFPGCFSAIVAASADKPREQLGAELAAACHGEGVHMYFDNTGGVTTHTVFPLLNEFALVAVCGQISHYHQTPSTAIESVPLLLTVLRKQVRVEGFMAGRWPDWSEAHEAIAAWLGAGDVRAPEQWTRGIERWTRIKI